MLVTGGAGFLGSHFVRHTLESGATHVTNVDALTYAGDTRRLADVEGDPRYSFVKADVADAEAVAEILEDLRPDAVVHYAADSHVTRSETYPDRFYRTNVEGTRAMLEAALASGVERYVHISTDEIYGPILEGAFREDDKREGDAQATSAYAKSKSLADDLARSYAARPPVIVARPTNAFGPWQYPEKALARWITRALRGERIPVWGDGRYVRQWLYAEDFARAIGLLLARGEPGEVYNVGPVHDPEITNIALARWVASYLELPNDAVELTEYDRPEHDRRYAVDSTKIRALGWAAGDVWSQLAATVEWYRSHEDWWEAHIAEAESIYTDVPKP